MSKFKSALSFTKNYLSEEKRGLIMAAVALFIIVILFMFYLKKIGIPMTSARNKYNLAVQMYEAKNYPKAKQLLQDSLGSWQTPEAETLLQEVNQYNPGL